MVNGRVAVARSLTQTKPSIVDALGEHRKRQDKFLAQCGSTTCADADLIFADPDGTLLCGARENHQVGPDRAGEIRGEQYVSKTAIGKLTPTRPLVLW